MKYTVKIGYPILREGLSIATDINVNDYGKDTRGNQAITREVDRLLELAQKINTKAGKEE